MIAPDETTFNYIKGRDFALKLLIGTKPSPIGKPCPAIKEAKFDRVLNIKAEDIKPMVTWGNISGAGDQRRWDGP